METCASVRECPATGKSDDLPDNPSLRIAQRIALPDPAVEVWLAPLEATAAALDQCSMLLSHDEKARVLRFQFERDRRRYTVARGMLRVLLGNYLGLSPHTLAFAQGPHGKPCLAGANLPVRFNLSHSSDMAIYAICRDAEPGVDIERLDCAIDHDGLARKFFSAREYAELQDIPAAARKRAFLKCWTCKEAIVKATGEGLRLSLDTVEVTLAPDAPPRLLSIPKGNAADWTLHSVDAGSAYTATIALHRVA